MRKKIGTALYKHITAQYTLPSRTDDLLRRFCDTLDLCKTESDVLTALSRESLLKSLLKQERLYNNDFEKMVKDLAKTL